MSSATADTAYDIRCEVTLLGAVVFTMANATAVLANLVLVVAESTVERRQLSQLIPLVIVLALRR